MISAVVKILNGKIKGNVCKNYLGGQFYEFLGIPYAQPPIGDLRFKAPLPATSWPGTLDATKPGQPCVSWHLISRQLIGDEATCLNLNVYSKEVKITENPKAVMVFIHGGGFTTGSNQKDFYGPEFLMTEDIVLVVINYRLGAFGFLSFEDPSLEISGNAGLKDMLLALKWVQNNIIYFNGDANNVTCFGQSSGAASIHYLSMSPLSKGLFHKIILQSGCALNPWARSPVSGRHLAKLLNFQEKNESAILKFLHSLDAKTITNAYWNDGRMILASYIRPIGPTIENNCSNISVITKEAKDNLKDGNFHHLPMMIGYNNNEGGIIELFRRTNSHYRKAYVVPGSNIPYELNLNKESQQYKQLSSEIKNFYNGLTTQHMVTDSALSYGIHKTIELHKQKTRTPIYFYRVSIETSLNLFKHISEAKYLLPTFILLFLAYKLNINFFKRLFLKWSQLALKIPVDGAVHNDELNYLFKSFLVDRLTSESPEEVSMRRFVKLWTNFAKTGNPTPGKDPLLNNVLWKPVTAENNHFLNINTTLTVDVNPDNERMKFWNCVYKKYQQN